MTRTGKIARLPLAIRQQLNQKLRDGQPGTQLIEWLNSLPQVQAVLKKEFDGQPIADNNLSIWKTGGYLAWEQAQADQEGLDSFMKKADGLKKAAKKGLADNIALSLVAKMALELNRLDTVPEGEDKAKTWRELLASLVLWRRGELHGEKLRLEQQKYRERVHQDRETRRQRRQEEPLTADEKQERIRQILGTE